MDVVNTEALAEIFVNTLFFGADLKDEQKNNNY